MKSKVALTIFLGLVVACLLFLNLRAILRPAKYEAVYQERCELNTNRLTSILLLQELYHERYHCYASHIDTLIDFYENGDLISINSRENPPQDCRVNGILEELHHQGEVDEGAEYLVQRL